MKKLKDLFLKDKYYKQLVLGVLVFCLLIVLITYFPENKSSIVIISMVISILPIIVKFYLNYEQAKGFEKYKMDLQSIYTKDIKNYSKKTEIIEELYKNIVDCSSKMSDLLCTIREVTGKTQEQQNQETENRVVQAKE